MKVRKAKFGIDIQHVPYRIGDILSGKDSQIIVFCNFGGNDTGRVCSGEILRCFKNLFAKMKDIGAVPAICSV